MNNKKPSKFKSPTTILLLARAEKCERRLKNHLAFLIFYIKEVKQTSEESPDFDEKLNKLTIEVEGLEEGRE